MSRPSPETAGGHATAHSKASAHLISLIDAATTSPADALDVGLIQSIKQIVRTSEDHVRVAFVHVMQKIQHNHAQVRLLALLVADELFTRSKLFRMMVVGDFETFMLHAVGYRSDCPLPPPANRACLLKAKSMEILEKWNDMFGPHYKPLRLGYEYLKKTLCLQFPNLRQSAAQAEQQRKEREARSRAVAQEKYEMLKADWPIVSSDVQSTLRQLEECFNILFSVRKQEDRFFDEDAGSFEELDASSLRRTLLEEAKISCLVPSETNDNEPVFDTLRELCRLVTSKHIPATQDWMSILMKVDTQDREPHNLLLRHVIDLRNQLLAASAKCQEMGVTEDDDKDGSIEEEIVWEDGVVGENGVVELNSLVRSSDLEIGMVEPNKDFVQSGGKVAAGNQEISATDLKSKNSSLNDARGKLLQEAPVVPWGPYLDRWGAEHSVPVNQRGLLLESHWGKVDYDALLPVDKVTELNMRVSYYKSKQVEIPPCLSPLKNGRLCQRRDFKICPLHGPIIPRDSLGNPLSRTGDDKGMVVHKDEGGSSDNAKGSGEDFMKMIADQAVANVRKKDAEEASKKLKKKLQAKRDREHNAAVLRTAALAHTSQGLGEVLREDLEKFGDGIMDSRQQSKKVKASLKAMLQPKPTSKERLSRRLLNARANEATVRLLSQDEDAAYREAFVNQW